MHQPPLEAQGTPQPQVGDPAPKTLVTEAMVEALLSSLRKDYQVLANPTAALHALEAALAVAPSNGMGCDVVTRIKARQHPHLRRALEASHSANRHLGDQVSSLQNDLARKSRALEAILELAQARSTGPETPDTLWEVRQLVLGST
jgi:hypothetical protein